MTRPADEVAEASGVFYVISSIAIIYDKTLSHGIPKSRKKFDVVMSVPKYGWRATVPLGG